MTALLLKVARVAVEPAIGISLGFISTMAILKWVEIVDAYNRPMRGLQP